MTKNRQKWTLGCPRVDIFGFRGRFLRGRKIIDFFIAVGAAKNRSKSGLGAPRVRKVSSGGAASRLQVGCSAPATSPGGPQYWIIKNMDQATIQGITHAMGSRPGELKIIPKPEK